MGISRSWLAVALRMSGEVGKGELNGLEILGDGGGRYSIPCARVRTPTHRLLRVKGPLTPGLKAVRRGD